MSITASHKVQNVQRQLLQKIQPLVTNRESLFQQCQPISYSLAQKLLLSSYKLHSAFGCWDPIKVGIIIDEPNSYQIPLTVFVNTVCFSTHTPFLQQYKEPDLIQPLPWPLDSSYPLIFHQYIYFFTSKENRNAFMVNPLKYLRQPKPTPFLPIKMAVVGPPKSGKTTGKDQDCNSYFNPYCCMFSNVLYSVYLFLLLYFFTPVARMFAQKYDLSQLSIGSVMRTVLNTQEHTDLAVQMKKYLTEGLIVPDELAIQCLEVALKSLECSTRGYAWHVFHLFHYC